MLGALPYCGTAWKVNALGNEKRKVPLWAPSEKQAEQSCGLCWGPALATKKDLEITQPAQLLILDAWRKL